MNKLALGAVALVVAVVVIIFNFDRIGNFVRHVLYPRATSTPIVAPTPPIVAPRQTKAAPTPAIVPPPAVEPAPTRPAAAKARPAPKRKAAPAPRPVPLPRARPATAPPPPTITRPRQPSDRGDWHSAFRRQ